MLIASHISHQGNKDWLKWESWDSHFYKAEWDRLTLKTLTSYKGSCYGETKTDGGAQILHFY